MDALMSFAAVLLMLLTRLLIVIAVVFAAGMVMVAVLKTWQAGRWAWHRVVHVHHPGKLS